MAARPEPYRPRRFDGLGLWPIGGGALKAYGISATPEAVETARIDAAKACVAALTIEGLDGGFVILHRGEEAMWLLVHWWMPGGILAERLFKAELDAADDYRAVDRPLMACVWELVVIAFERDAYVETRMSGRDAQAYLARTLPDGSY